MEVPLPGLSLSHLFSMPPKCSTILWQPDAVVEKHKSWTPKVLITCTTHQGSPQAYVGSSVRRKEQPNMYGGSCQCFHSRHREVQPLHHSKAAIPLLSQLFLLALEDRASQALSLPSHTDAQGWGLGAYPCFCWQGCLRAREIPPRPGQSLQLSASQPHHIYLCPLFTKAWSIRFKKKKKKSKGKH